MKAMPSLSITSLLMLSMGCSPRHFNTAESKALDASSTPGKIAPWTSLKGIGFWRTHDKPTWIFHYSDVEGLASRDPIKYLTDAQAQWTRCQDYLRAGDVQRAKSGPCDNGGAWRGMGLYFAADPFASAKYGNTMIAVRIKPNIAIPSLYSPGSKDAWSEYTDDTKEELWKTDVPATRYSWGPGYFSNDAIIVRDMPAVILTAPSGAPEVYQFSGARPQRGSSRRAGVSFSAAPSLACNKSEPFPEKLKRAAVHPFFMHQVANELRMKESGQAPKLPILDASGKLTAVGRMWAIASEVNARTPSVLAGLSKIPSMNLRGDLAGFANVNFFNMEYLEVLVEYKYAGNETIDASYVPWFTALGFLPPGSENNAALSNAQTLVETLGKQWAAQPNAEARALEAYQLTRCVLDDMANENIARWTVGKP